MLYGEDVFGRKSIGTFFIICIYGGCRFFVLYVFGGCSLYRPDPLSGAGGFCFKNWGKPKEKHEVYEIDPDDIELLTPEEYDRRKKDGRNI